MRPLVLLWGCLVLPGYEALKGPKEISGFEGDTVSLRCTYVEKMKEHRKYWCRQGGILVSRCGDIVYANQDQEVTRGRMSIRDSPQELSMTVIMRDLTLKDSGKYWCGIDRLGRDESFEVTLIVFPGKRDNAVPAGTCCPSSPTPSFQPLTPTRSLQPKAKAWQTQLPEPRSSRPVVWLPLTTPQDSRAVASSVSKPSVSIPMVRMMAPVLILLSLLLAAGLIAFGSHMLRWRKKAWLATETQKNEKVYLETSLPGNGWTTEDSTIDLAVTPECLRNLNPSAVPSPETQNLSQSTEEEEAARSLDDDKEDVMAPPPLQMSAEELAFSEFISV
ncbi:CMRF35-like molecule 9 isoform 3 precursor [Mus musculus]|uniref:CMRF35-like molecule 9 n=2 Tax=Mus musculus TaxID=10090 RepID=CLM9_MOUSE|nr:CMRF35-like molecule 9 isoform 3 precursor [Mus musculus]Q1ERP8.1 RecName: Full=CMRF35-like molecule 9; Short=CLM-9; AltName: Full=CD300 antigen-like family member G; AltName: Full=Nepmucin; AltName: CD_antigen=CD300g; Flags: Precursor [Mus musculus]BAE96048.1 nepmucin isoform C [Mus musculus]|eukprot:NP_001154184.1 CMRF35-like molecule 9 isoform 3 precursor [Mus musculus]